MTSDATRFFNQQAQASSETLTRIPQASSTRAKLGRTKIGEVLPASDDATHRLGHIWTKVLKLAVSVLTLFIASYGYAQNAFTITSVNPVLAENTETLSAINDLITSALHADIRSAPFDNFKFELDPVGKTKFTLSTAAPLALSLKTGESLDYEQTRSIRFLILATKKSDSSSPLGNNGLTITLTLTPVDEEPEVLGDFANAADAQTGRVFYVQKNPDVGTVPSIFAHQVFRDPEGLPIALKPCADDFMVIEYDSSDTQLSGNGITNPRGSFEDDAHNENAATGTARHCTPPTDTGNYAASRDVTRNGSVVNVTTQGSLVRITPIAADTASVHRAVITFRGWAGAYENDNGVAADPDNDAKISDVAKITVYVKTGVNNPPSFSATGFRVFINESTDATTITTIGPPTASPGSWDASDIDGDTISYRLDGPAASLSCRTNVDGTIIEDAVALGRGCAWLEPITDLNPNVQIKGRNLDYESAPLPDRTYTIYLVAQDGYNLAGVTPPQSRIGIQVVIQNIDEGLEFNGPIDEIKQLVLGRAGRTVDLNDYFTDPDGLAIAYSAFSSAPGIVSVATTGSSLTVSPGTSAGTTIITITATAVGSADVLPITIPITVRETNRPPEFEQSILTVQVPNPVAETQATDHIIRLSSLRYNDPDGDTISATILNSGVFEAVVDPVIGDQTYTGEVGIKLIGSLDFETTPQHTLQIQLSDGWDTSTRTVSVIVDVGNVNEAPRLATDPSGVTRTIPPQTVSVNGTGSIDVGSYFTDPDRGDRLLISAAVSNPTFATVQVTGDSTVQFTGLLETGVTPVTVTVTARDLGGLSVQAAFQLTVSSNRPPRLIQAPLAQTLTVHQGAQEVSLLGTFVDDDPGDRIARYEATSSDDSIVIAQVSNDGVSVVLIPRAEGQATVTVTAHDTRGGMGTTSFLVTVLGNSPPEITQLISTVTLRPNGTTTLDVTNYFSDPDGDALTFSTSVDQPNIATTTLFNNRTLTIQGRSRGQAEVTVTAFDPDGESVSSTFLVAVTNEDPVGTGQITSSITYRGDTDTIDVAGNFTDGDDDPLTYSVSVVNESVVEASIEGTMVSLTAVGIGATSVTVTATDPYDASGSLSFVVTIINQGPTVVTPIPNQATHRDGELSIDLSAHFADADNDDLTYSVEVANTQIASATVNGSNLMITGNRLGSTVVTITVVDNFGGRISSFFNLEVQNRDPQTTMMFADQTMVRAAPVEFDLSTFFSDPDGDDLMFDVSVSNAQIVTASITGMTLTVEGIGVGESMVTVTANDDLTDMPASASFNVTVENQAPVVAIEIEDQEITRQEMIVVDLSMIFEDPDNDPLDFEANVANSAVATAMIQGSTMTVTGQTVNNTLVTVTATDEFGGTVSDIFRVTVANQAPHVAQEPDDVIINRTEMPTIDMSMVFADNDGDTLTLSAESATPAVALVRVSDFDVTLQPLTLGTTEVTLEVVDPYNETASTTFTVTVENLAPRVSMTLPFVSLNRVDTHTVDVSGVFVDDDGDDMVITASSADTNLVTTSVTGTSLTLDGINLGMTMVTVTATDANGGTISTTFNVRVDNLDPAVATVIEPFALQVGGDTETRDVSAAFSDDGSEVLVLSVTVDGPEVATATLADMMLVVTPVARGITSLSLTATDAQGATVEQIVRIDVTDSELKKVANTALASFSRAVLNSVSATIGSRLMADADGLYTPFTTYSLDDFTPSEDFVQPIDGFSNVSPFADHSLPWSHGPSQNALGYSPNGAYDIASMLGRGFALKLAAAGDPTFWSIWGGADRQTFEGPDHEGNASSFYFGADMTMQGRWTFGLAVGRNAGESDYTYGTATQTLDITLTGVYPYVRAQPSDRTTIYGTFGVASGDLETTIIGDNIDPADLKGNIGLLGGRQVVYTMPNGFNLGIVGDYGWANLETDDAPGSAGNLTAETSRIRAGVESSFNMAMGADGSFVPFVTVGFRSDSGDDEIADSGVEISGGLRITNPIFSLDANFRTLATYGTDDYSESGFSVMAVLNPSAGATGLNISVAPSWGASTISTNALWQDDFKADRYHQMAAFTNLNQESVKWDSYVGYGFLVLDERFILTPFLDVRTGYSSYQDFSIGAKLFQSLQAKQDLNVDVKIGQDSSMTGTPEESVQVNARLNF
ncbi:MAG: hypothetical protein OXG15_03210 [Gammaproteobacteria bacterium]|nr:hypothetical protein [Gammaproteobacteria bacterium]